MRRVPPLPSLVVLSALWSCGAEPPPPLPGDAIDFVAVSETLVERLDLQEGERILLVAMPGSFDAVVPLIREEVVARGGVDLGVWSVDGPPLEDWDTPFTESLRELSGEALVEALVDVDAALMLPGATAAHPVYAAMQEVLRQGHGRTIHFHWAGAYNLDGLVRDVDIESAAVYERALLETDYAALAGAQRAFEEAMRESTVRVTTPAGTDLSFQIGDRPVTRQDGNASAARAAQARNLIDREIELPAGAVRVAPVELSVQGTIAFPPSVWSGEPVEGLVLTFEDGVVTDASAEVGLAAAEAEMNGAGDAGRAFREFALGFNPLLTIQREGLPWIPYYGYGAGVVRLSLGDNTELGGDVGGGWVRWNFFTDATVTVDGEVWVEDGRLVR